MHSKILNSTKNVPCYCSNKIVCLLPLSESASSCGDSKKSVIEESQMGEQGQEASNAEESKVVKDEIPVEVSLFCFFIK